MKKRALTLILAVLTCASTALMLSSCGKHTFNTDWEKDATHHWHACADADCTKVSEKAEHTWGEGKETTFATEEQDGVITYTCTVCKQTKTEASTFDGLNVTQYGEAVYDETLQNVTVAIKTVAGGQTLNSKLTLNGNEYAHSGNIPGGTVLGSGSDPMICTLLRGKYLFFSNVLYKYLSYDATTKVYNASNDCTISFTDEIEDTVTTYKSIKMTFVGNRVSTVTAEFETTQEFADPITGTIELTLSAYGTTEVIIEDTNLDPDLGGDPDPDPDLGGDPIE